MVAVESSLPRPSAWSRLAPTSLAAGEPSPALLVRTRRSTTQPALLRLPSVPPWTGRSPSREGRTKAKTTTTGTPRRGPRRQELKTRARTKKTQATKTQQLSDDKDSRRSVLAPLGSAGLRPSQRGAPPVAPPHSRLHLPSRSLSKGGVPSLRPPHAMHPPIGSELPHPFPSHQARGKFRRKNSGGRIQAGKVHSGPTRAFVAAILRPSFNGSCRGDRRRVVRGGRRSECGKWRRWWWWMW